MITRPNSNQRPQRGTPIIIACDGVNTEPQYFKLLQAYCYKERIDKVHFKKIEGRGYNRLKTIERGMELYKEVKKEMKGMGDNGDVELWCVFDGDPKRDDSNHDNGFVKAVSYVDGKSSPKWLFGAYSFEAFEYWFLLHFERLDGSPMSRNDYITRLNNYLESISSSIRYDKDRKEVSDAFFQILMERVDVAIANAEKVDDGSWEPTGQAHERNSITKVYKLVRRILGK